MKALGIKKIEACSDAQLPLSKKFERTLFNKLNINLEKGEILAITGPSGCGKTTLLRCICGLEKLDSGSIFLNGKEITNNPAEVRNIGLLFQKPIIHIYQYPAIYH